MKNSGIRNVGFVAVLLLASSVADAGVQFNVDLNPFGWGLRLPRWSTNHPATMLPLPSSTMVMAIGEIATGAAATNGDQSGITTMIITITTTRVSIETDDLGSVLASAMYLSPHRPWDDLKDS